MKLSSRLNKYFAPNLENFVFDELSDSALTKMQVLDILKGIPVPLQEEDLHKIADGEGVSAARVAVNMAYVLGCDPGFRLKDSYLEFMDRLFMGEMYGGVIKAGEAEADGGQLESACVYFRAALVLRDRDLKAMYGYAMATRELYLAASSAEEGEADEAYIGLFKAETIETLEQITIDYPDFPEPHYFLGYAYLNMGLYVKADLAFRDFLACATDASQKEEVRQRREQLAGPVKIEQGINHIVSGRFDAGIELLEPYVGNPAADEWWPLHYYLGEAYHSLGMDELAIARYKRCLQLNTAHLDSMQALVEIYQDLGDEEGVEKYSKKIDLIRSYEE